MKLALKLLLLFIILISTTLSAQENTSTPLNDETKSNYTKDLITKEVEELINKGYNLNKQDPSTGLTTLMEVAKIDENPELIEALIEHGADVNAKDFAGTTVLMYASVYNNNPAIIETLIKHGADINAKDRQGRTALILAITNDKDVTTIDTLIANGANVNDKFIHNSTALYLAASISSYTEVIETLINHGAIVRADDLCAAAASTRNLAIIEKIAQHLPDINEQDDDGDTGLMAAVYNSNPQAVETLLKLGADINIKNNNG